MNCARRGQQCLVEPRFLSSRFFHGQHWLGHCFRMMTVIWQFPSPPPIFQRETWTRRRPAWNAARRRKSPWHRTGPRSPSPPRTTPPWAMAQTHWDKCKMQQHLLVRRFHLFTNLLLYLQLKSQICDLFKCPEWFRRATCNLTKIQMEFILAYCDKKKKNVRRKKKRESEQCCYSTRCYFDWMLKWWCNPINPSSPENGMKFKQSGSDK